MSGNGEDNVLDLGRKFGVEELMKRSAARREAEAAKPHAETPPEAEEPLPSIDELSVLPKPGNPYKAYSRASSQPLLTLHLLTADGQKWTLPYSGRVEGPHMLSVEPGKGMVLVTRFAASVALEVIAAGTLLDDLHVYLSEHRIRWIRELPPGKLRKDDGAPAVRTLIVRPVSAKMAAIWPIAPQAGRAAGKK